MYIEVKLDKTHPIIGTEGISYKQGANGVIKRIWNWIIGRQ